MFIYNDYNNYKMWIQYYFLKNCPYSLYPLILGYFYKNKIKKKLNLKNPQKLSEKLCYLKLYDITPEKIMLTDKISAKEYIRKIIPELSVAKIFQIGSTFEDLNFSKCPEKFVIKTNHACKTGIYTGHNDLTEKNYNKYKRYFERVLGINYAFWGTLELQYKNIKPKIFIEEFLQNSDDTPFIEYEVYCFNGEVEFIECHNFNCCRDMNYECGTSSFNNRWEFTEFRLFSRTNWAKCIPPIYNRDKIIEYSKIISKDFKFVRCDFFEVDKKLYFGECTFTPYMGELWFDPEKYDLILGQKLDIF